jgi:hypothetical protein
VITEICRVCGGAGFVSPLVLRPRWIPGDNIFGFDGLVALPVYCNVMGCISAVYFVEFAVRSFIFWRVCWFDGTLSSCRIYDAITGAVDGALYLDCRTFFRIFTT